MDVISWRVSAKEAAQHAKGVSDMIPGVGIEVRLQCRICSSVTERWESVGLYPVIKRGEALPHAGHPSHGERWNVWIIGALARDRHCRECGYGSIIPPAQQAALIVATAEAATHEWLGSLISELELRVGMRLVAWSDRPSERMYEPYYVRPSEERNLEVALDWNPFDLLAQSIQPA